jgi:formimidoylglutamate deiminase
MDARDVARGFHFTHALLPQGWATSVRLDVMHGRILSLQVNTVAQPRDIRLGVVIPGMGNVHSHAFQRGMAGLTEVAGASMDSFWSWREVMYRFLERLCPDGLEAIAAMAYAEMLEAGFTRVGEFHYLHHARNGRPYAQVGEMCGRIAAAAQRTGIGLTLLPVFYAHSDFGGAPPLESQRRLICDMDGFAQLLDQAAGHVAALGDGQLGIAPHSLRATTPTELSSLITLNEGPIHIHIAEQTAEVQACLAWSGQRPVQWLLEHAPVDPRWCLVHATHVSADEVTDIASRGAVVGLCPITEANLGDGLFPARDFLDAGGRIGIGSDSNVLIDLAEELRLLEYGQRLHQRQRNVLARGSGHTSGRYLFDQTLAGGALALGVECSITPGASADLVELEISHPALLHRQLDHWLDGWLFSARAGAVRTVWRRGEQVVEGGRHRDRPRIERAYAAALHRVLE